VYYILYEKGRKTAQFVGFKMPINYKKFIVESVNNENNACCFINYKVLTDSLYKLMTMSVDTKPPETSCIKWYNIIIIVLI